MRTTTWLLLPCCLFLACSDDDDEKKPTTPPAQACLDTADAAAKAAQRCGQDYQTNYNAFVQAAAAGSCDNIVSVRDEASLRGECFAWFNSVPCDELVNSTAVLPSACEAQLIRPASADPGSGGLHWAAALKGVGGTTETGAQ